ncbi:MAG: DUF975 family protein [Lachnospiraceae bacterium]|nr:DUF975 family protein [Lachnospiraceae bacterium]
MRPVSDLKAIARRRMSGHNKILAGAAALTILMIFTLNMAETAIMIMGIDFRLIDSINDLLDAFSKPQTMLMTYGLSLIIALLSQLIITGFKRVCLIVARDIKPSLADLFFPFKYNPDKIIIISFIVWVGSSAGSLTSLLGSGAGAGLAQGRVSGSVFFAGMLLEVVSAVILVLVNSYMFAAYYIYLDYPEKPVSEIIRESIRLMRGNVLRLIYLTLTFVGWFVLVIFTYGIALIYVGPYLFTVYGLFYRDLKGELGNGFNSEA